MDRVNAASGAGGRTAASGTRWSGTGAARLGRLLLALFALGGLACACSTQPAPGAMPASGSSPGPASATAPSATASPVGSARFPASLVLSVLYFDDRTQMSDLAWLRKGMADMLVAEFARIPSLLVVQRERMEEVFREQAFQMSGRVADESAVRVGRIAGATVLVTGSVSVVDGRLRIDAQLLGVEEGTVLGTASAEGRLKDVSATARSLVAKVVELLPGAAERRVSVEGEAGQGLVQAARANDRGELLSRQGKLFQAMEEFERAVAADPANPSARSNFSRTVQSLSGADLLRMSQADPSRGSDRQVVGRLVERLVGSGLEADLGTARSEVAADGSLVVRVPVRFRLSGSAVTAVLESAQAMGGKVEKKPGGVSKNTGSAVINVTLAKRQDLNREFTRQLGIPRRIYLRLLSPEGRTIAIYSSWRDWQVATWVAPLDGQQVKIQSDFVLASEAVFAGLTAAQLANVGGAKMTIETVPRERTILRLEVSESEDQSRQSGRQPSLQWGQWQNSPDIPWPKPRPLSQQADSEDAPAVLPLQPLREELERAWNPPVTERGWGRGYLPSNERTTIVTVLVDMGGTGVREESRLAKPSGDAEFDRAAVAATEQAVQRWTAALAVPATAAPSDLSAKEQGVGLRERRLMKIRAQFKLLKDVPVLNLIGAMGAIDHPRSSESPVLSPDASR